MFIYLYVYMFICLYVYMFICLYVYMFVCLYVYMFMSPLNFACVYNKKYHCPVLFCYLRSTTRGTKI